MGLITDKTKTPTEYGYELRWNNFNGSQAVTVNGHETRNKALADCIGWAYVFGWREPRWWQWWRWSDERPEPFKSES
jgi:hypothetical protein